MFKLYSCTRVNNTLMFVFTQRFSADKMLLNIMQACPCIILHYFTAVKMAIFS